MLTIAILKKNALRYITEMLYYALILLPCFFPYKAAPMSLNLFEAALVHKTREKKIHR